MRCLIPSQTALVLGGGGAKGAYEIGAIEALESLGVRAGSVYGTSVGALNAAMYAQGRMEQAAALWAELKLEDLVTAESLAQAEQMENLFNQSDKLLEFLTRSLQQKPPDVTPYVRLLERYVDEDALRRSKIRFGLVATRFPTLSRAEKRIDEMEPGSVHSWLLASSAFFPVFPIAAIGEERYVDGGFTDNVPVGMAIREGARHIIALDIGKQPAHTQYERRPNITYIRASHPLGGLLSFDPARFERNRALGRNDTLRALGDLRGVRYSFDAVSARSSIRRAESFLVDMTQWDTLVASGRKGGEAPLFALLEKALPPAADAVDYLLRALEICADAAQLDPVPVYTMETFAQALRGALPLDKADAMLDSLPGGRIGVLFAPPQPDRRVVISCLYKLLQREKTFPPLAMRTLSAFPREMLCALTLREILG